MPGCWDKSAGEMQTCLLYIFSSITHGDRVTLGTRSSEDMLLTYMSFDVLCFVMEILNLNVDI